MYARSQSSDTLKNAMIIVMRMIIAARNIPITLDHDLVNVLNTDKASATHAAMINSWMIEIVNGQMLNVIPANNPLFIFLG